MGIISRISRNVRFLSNVYKEKGAIRNLLESGNIVFLRYSTPGHYYSPIPNLRDIRSGSRARPEGEPTALPSIDLHEGRQIRLASLFSDLYHDLPFTDRKTERFRYFLDNGYFSYGDGIVLYAFLRTFAPKRVIEIGSGYSSALMLDTSDLFLDNATHFTFIEPYPNRLLSLLNDSDKSRVRIEEKPVQEVDTRLFSSLEANDILFVDSSHMAKWHSDVVHVIFHILPSLNNGVIIHFHDVLWPFEYPENWFEIGRAWNEAYFLRAFLQNNIEFEILYFNSYMALYHEDLLVESMPKVLKAPTSKGHPGNTSLWVRKGAQLDAASDRVSAGER
jgi:predicted O-methyltransferase YrrM